MRTLQPRVPVTVAHRAPSRARGRRAWGAPETVAAVVVVAVLGAGVVAWQYGTPALSERLRDSSEPVAVSDDGVAWRSADGSVRLRLPAAPVLIEVDDGPVRLSLAVAAAPDGGQVIVVRSPSAAAPRGDAGAIATVLVAMVVDHVVEADVVRSRVRPAFFGGQPAVELTGRVPHRGSTATVRATVVTGKPLVGLVGIGADDAHASALATMVVSG